MHRPLIRGTVSRQARVAWPEGTVEDEHGRNGFEGDVSMLYRSRPPTQWTRIEGPDRPRAFVTYDLKPGDQVAGDGQPTCMVQNQDVAVSLSRRTEPMPFYFRNCDGEEVHFVHAGTGRLETEYGDLSFEPGDYLVIPRATTYRVHPTSHDLFVLIVEARSGQVSIPERGPLGNFLPFDLAMLDYAEPPASREVEDRDEWEIRIKRGGRLTSFFYDYCPMDVVGWVGTVAPFKINVREFRSPHSERSHIPPSAYATFCAPGFYIITFTPKPFETAPDAVRPPGYHRNVDYDEVVFSHSGKLMSRVDAPGGLMSVHPAGVHHGPHPKSFELANAEDRMDAYVISVDAHSPLVPTAELETVEFEDYWRQWSSPLSGSPLGRAART
jgi:homogentisate 1,2-dioxygenase